MTPKTDFETRPVYPERLTPSAVQGPFVLARYAGGHHYAVDVLAAARYKHRSRVLRRWLERESARGIGCPRCWTHEGLAVSIRQYLFPRFHTWRDQVTWIHAPMLHLDCRACEKPIEGGSR